LSENNLVNDGDFDWVKRLQEFRLVRNKGGTNTTNVAGTTSANVAAASSLGVAGNAMRNILTTTNAPSTVAPVPAVRSHNQPQYSNDNRNRPSTQRSSQHLQLPLSTTNRSTNATTGTLNGGSKTTISMASTGKLATTLPSSSSSRNATENHRPGPPPTKRRGLVPAPPPLPSYSYHHTHQQQYSANVNNSNNNYTNKDQHGAAMGHLSEPTCCFFKRKAKHALQITTTAPRRT
jgi:hypothetical protein